MQNGVALRNVGLRTGWLPREGRYTDAERFSTSLAFH